MSVPRVRLDRAFALKLVGPGTLINQRTQVMYPACQTNTDKELIVRFRFGTLLSRATLVLSARFRNKRADAGDRETRFRQERRHGMPDVRHLRPDLQLNVAVCAL